MAFILNLETATTVCSVSLAENGRQICARELDQGFTHAENLHGFILEVLKEAGLEARQLNAVAVSKGPGSYTGLRIGVSTAKGLAYALGVPLIAVDTLQIMSHKARSLATGEGFYCPMIDARRMEVYTAFYNTALDQVQPIEALIVDESSIQAFRQYSKIWFFGDGMPKCRELLSQLPAADFIDNCFPSASHMCELSFHKFQAGAVEDVAYFEPFYLKDFLITAKKGSR